ncbi:hypothetical protein JTE90_004354 [Oedothorax gibbosus]|uniref:BTB domain-containing protein n=1 Tax=Oedothorax gibbosus TaxID=931172 RepID=A0AAV6VKJ7_9ARAC|nr:hypothetical protein JTE90_004354 [Oedothorax gibbosus]
MQVDKNSKEFYEDRINLLENEFYTLYKAKIKTDVEIYLKTEEVDSGYFKAHKLILAAKSTVFENLFWNSSNSRLEVVVVDGVTSSGLNLLLEYIYYDNLETKTVEEFIELSKAALRFEVTGVVGKCKQLINDYPLSAENVFGVLEASQSKYFNLEQVKTKCLDFIKDISPYFLYVDSSGILQLSAPSMHDILSTRNISLGCEAFVLEGVIRFLVHKRLENFTRRRQQFLSEVHILSLTSEEFLDITVKYPDFFTHQEIDSVFYNLLRLGMKKLPSWCRPSNWFSSKCVSSTYDSIASKSLQFETECNRPLSKCILHDKDYFQESMLLEIRISPHTYTHLHLTMLELAFGSDYVPISNLKIELFYLKESIKMVEVEFSLQETRDHYYIILRNRLNMAKKIPCILKLDIKMSGLKKWGINGPVSNRKYRIVQMPENIFCNMRLTDAKYASFDPICLTPLSDWLVLIDPVENEKKFVLTSFYFN